MLFYSLLRKDLSDAVDLQANLINITRLGRVELIWARLPRTERAGKHLSPPWMETAIVHAMNNYAACVKRASPVKRQRAWVQLGICGLFLPLTMPLVQPFADTGMNDDWSYIESARLLAKTGHLVYTGWSAPMLGWQLYLSNVLVHCFGSGFLVIRAGTILIASLLGLVLHRLFVRGGLTETNATMGTLTILCSPLFFPLAYSYMTDVYGLFCFCLVLYLCMRAVLAVRNRTAFVWMVAAVISGTVLGSTRQIAWLGVIVICPSALVLLRRKKAVVAPVAVLLIASWLSIAFCIHRFRAMPLTQSESVPPITLKAFAVAAKLLGAYLPLEMAVLLLPISLLFIPVARRTDLARAALVEGGGVAAVAALAVLLHKQVALKAFFPYLMNYVSVYGAVGGTYLQGERPLVLTTAVRASVTFCGLVAATAWLLVARRPNPVPRTGTSHERVSLRQLRILVLPFVSLYLLLLVPRSLDGQLFDRYLLILMVLSILFLLRFYQERAQQPMMWPAVAALVLFAGYSVASTHDVFALHRARVKAVQELLQAGIAPSEIDGGFEFNGLYEVQTYGYVPAPRLKETTYWVYPETTKQGRDCRPQLAELFPHLHAHYAISFQPNACAGPTHLPATEYTAWLGPRHVPLYIIRLGPEADVYGSMQPHNQTATK